MIAPFWAREYARTEVLFMDASNNRQRLSFATRVMSKPSGYSTFFLDVFAHKVFSVMTEPPPSKLSWFFWVSFGYWWKPGHCWEGDHCSQQSATEFILCSLPSSLLFLIVLAAHQVLLNLVYGSSENLANCGLLRARRCRRRDACNLAFVAYLNASLLMKNFESFQVQRKHAYKKSTCFS